MSTSEFIIGFFITAILTIILMKIAESIYHIVMEQMENNKYHIVDLTIGGTDDQILTLINEFRFLDIDANPLVEIASDIDKPDKIKRYAIGVTDRVDFINTKVLRLYLKISKNIDNEIKSNLLNFMRESLIKHVLGVSLAYETKAEDKKYDRLVIVVDDKLPDAIKSVLEIVNESI